MCLDQPFGSVAKNCRRYLMDPNIGWYQPEQLGPARDLWLQIWETGRDFESLALKNNNSSNNIENVTTAVTNITVIIMS